MDKNNHMMTLALVAIVAIIALFTMIGGNVQLGSSSEFSSVGNAFAAIPSEKLQRTGTVNAHSCNADDTCEMTNADVRDNLVADRVIAESMEIDSQTEI